jgi:nicotinate dehydrogenase subunit A
MTVEALLRRNPHPTEQELRNELHHNLCRCGTHVEIMQAALRAVQLRAERAALQASFSDPSSRAGEVQP